MSKAWMVSLLILSSHLVVAKAQDTSDVALLKTMEYLKYAYLVDCDSSLSSTLEERICLNLKFQEQDSIMNFYFGLIMAKNQKTSSKLLEEHNEFILNRRLESSLATEGLSSGNFSGIIYLGKMLAMTEERILLYEDLLASLNLKVE